MLQPSSHLLYASVTSRDHLASWQTSYAAVPANLHDAQHERNTNV
jgi:hypothetical protein